MKERSAYFDNAKLILIFLVVLGHSIDYLALGNPLLRAIDYFLCIFHMPAFALLSGYFSKGSIDFRKRIARYFIIYVIFEIPYYFMMKGAGDLFFSPHYVLWYLCSLILWEILLLFYEKIKYPVALAFAVGLIVGYFDTVGGFLSLSRTFVFFPFFILGYKMNESAFDRLNKPLAKAAAAIVLSAALIYLCIYGPVSDVKWLSGAFSYSSMSHYEWYAAAYRLLTYAAAIIMCLCFFIIVPRKRFVLTFMGGNTMNTFVLHGFFAVWIGGTGIYENLGAKWGGIFVVIFAVALTLVLSIVNILSPKSWRITKRHGANSISNHDGPNGDDKPATS